MAATTEARSAADLIPVLDLGPLIAGDARALDQLASELHIALTDIGFFFVVNHGVPWSLVDEVYDAARELHAHDPELLAAATMDKDHGGYLGYAAGTSYASEIAGDVRTPNLNSAFFVHQGGYRIDNRYPQGLPNLQPTVERYVDAVNGLALALLPVLASSLDLPADWFEPHFDVPSSTLRMSHYPVVEYGDHDWGLAPHTDSTVITLLPANDVPGLEIRPAGHDWIEPPQLAESFLINSGDMLKRWTNGRFRSTAHRARNRSDVDRYAIPFFFGARDDALIEALPTCVDAEQPPRHEPITYGDYQRWFLNRNYAAVTGEAASDIAP